MKRKHLLTALTAAMLLPILVLAAAFCIPPRYQDTWMGAFSDKLEAAEAASGPRILIAGGSGAAFALRCDLLESQLPGYRAVNLGMYAGLGSTASLKAAVKQARAGDIIVFLPEQNEQTLSDYFGAEALWQAADGHWSLLGLTPEGKLPQLLAQLPYFAAGKAQYFLQGDFPEPDGIYRRSSFNAWGDIDSVLRTGNVMPLGYDPTTAVSFDASLPTEGFLAAVNAAQAACRAAGATLYFAGCPVNAGAVADDAEAQEYALRLSSSLTCEILPDSLPCILESGWFYDTNFHLNSAGAVVYTAQLARSLRSALELPGEVDIPLPEMPERQSARTETGDCSDADCFLYEIFPDSGTAAVIALSDAAGGRDALTIPTHYEGLEVSGIRADALTGNHTLRSLTLQPGLRWIEDGAFRGCGLEELLLRDILPASCTVGSGLLDGCSARILVSPEQLGAFRTNYFWAALADRIVPAELPAGSADEDPAVPGEQPEEGIRYDLGGSVLIQAPDARQLRSNTPAWSASLAREGHTLYGWNTSPDFSGTPIVPGGRVQAQSGDTLYAQWVQQSPETDFAYEAGPEGASITRWLGSGSCVVPDTLGGQRVVRIRAGAFRDTEAERLILCPGLETIEPEAFAGCSIGELTFFDTLQSVSDVSFPVLPQKIRVCAAAAPVYGTSYFALFADKYDWLLSLQGQRKLVLFAGSSTRYAYDSARIHRAYPAYTPANMGVYAYTNARQQLDLILLAMEPGDVLLHAPEFEPLDKQFCETMELEWQFWAMAEADYGLMDALELTQYTHVFDSFSKYQSVRSGMPAGTYADSPNGYDDDGYRRSEDTYSRYGDLIMLRDGTKIDVMLQHVRADYTPEPFTRQRLDAINGVYRRFLDRGITVLFTFSARNRSSLTEQSTPENRALLQALLQEQLCVPVISRLESSLLSGEYFYLIDSHLSTEGARVFTEQIISALKPWLTA